MPDHVPNPPLLDRSPEDTHRWACTRCTNTTRFIGVDDRGFGGPDECDGSCGYDPDASDVPESSNYCSCDTVLTQEFTVLAQDGTLEGEDIDYAAYTGGGEDSEIGTYTRIHCGACEALLWLDPTLPAETRALVLGEAGLEAPV